VKGRITHVHRTRYHFFYDMADDTQRQDSQNESETTIESKSDQEIGSTDTGASSASGRSLLDDDMQQG